MPSTAGQVGTRQLYERAVYLSFLPMAHIYGRWGCSTAAVLAAGGRPASGARCPCILQYIAHHARSARYPQPGRCVEEMFLSYGAAIAYWSGEAKVGAG